MKLSDPFTGWREGWIGQGPYIGWLSVLLTVWMVAGWVIRTSASGAITAEGLLALHAPGVAQNSMLLGLSVLLHIPLLLLTAKRWRDAGAPGWPLAIAQIALATAVEQLMAVALFPSVTGFLLVAALPADSCGSRIARGSKVDPDVFS